MAPLIIPKTIASSQQLHDVADVRKAFQAIHRSVEKVENASPRLNWHRHISDSAYHLRLLDQDAAKILGRQPERVGAALRELRQRVISAHERYADQQKPLYAETRQKIREGRYGRAELVDDLNKRGDDFVMNVLGFSEAPLDRAFRRASPEWHMHQGSPPRIAYVGLRDARVSPNDLVYELGSGAGQTALLIDIATRARVIGVERDPALHRAAIATRNQLGMKTVALINTDVRDLDYSDGSVFYLYNPFSGATLDTVLEKIKDAARLRPIRVITFMSDKQVRQQSWLVPDQPYSRERCTVFRSAKI